MPNDRQRAEALARDNPEALARARAELRNRLLIPHAGGQEDILRSQARFRTLAAGRRWGKTKVAAHEIVRRARKPNQMVWWIANAQPLDEPVLTPNGWRTMGALKVGDVVTGSDGHPTKVLGVYPHADREIWEVEMSDGSVARCADDHLWYVEQLGHSSPRVLKTRELAERGLRQECGRSRFSIPNAAPAAEGNNPRIDGYLLGAMLGDGCIRANQTLLFANQDDDIVARVRAAAEASGATWKQYGPINFGISNAANLRRQLAEVGLVDVRSKSKFLPPAVLQADMKYRASVLAGLLDTDGGNASGGVQFTSKSERLARGVTDLARSLGGRATARHDGRIWRARVSMPYACPFYCARKATAWKPVPRAAKRQIVDVRRTDNHCDMVCIEVDALDHLYITTGYLLSHNTYKNVSRGYREVVNQLPPSWLAKPAPAYTSTTKILQLKNGTMIEFYSGGSPDSLAGEGVDFVVVDEAALIADNVWQQLIRPTLMDTGGEAFIISTPRGHNWFYQMWKLGQEQKAGYDSWRFAQTDNPYVPAEETQSAKEELPTIIFQQEIMAEFLASGASIFGLGLQRDGSIIDEIVEPRGNIFVGIDLAKKQDFTVITADREEDGLPCYFERFNELDWPTQQKRIGYAIEELEQTPGVEGVTAMIDSTGIGDVVYDNLTAAGVDVTPVQFTNQSKEQMARLLAADLEHGRARILSDMKEEFESYEFTLTASGRYQFEASSGHDDMVAAKMLAHWGRVHEGGQGIEIVSVERDDPNAEARLREAILVSTRAAVADPIADIINRPEAWDHFDVPAGAGRGFFGG